MLIEGGIYNDNLQKNVCFIFLKEDSEKYYGVDIDQIKITQFKKQCIEDRLLTLKKNKELKNLYYWKTDKKFLTESTDGYLGKIDNDLYLLLCKYLERSASWIYNHYYI